MQATENRSNENGQNNIIMAQCAMATETVMEVVMTTGVAIENVNGKTKSHQKLPTESKLNL